MLDDANWWLLGVDFWEHSHELFEKFSDAYIINDLPTPSGTALPYEDVHIHDLQELKEFLLTPDACSVLPPPCEEPICPLHSP